MESLPATHKLLGSYDDQLKKILQEKSPVFVFDKGTPFYFFIFYQSGLVIPKKLKRKEGREDNHVTTLAGRA